MLDKEIIVKCIQKALVGGATRNPIDIDMDFWVDHKFYYAVIFSEEFSKAFWGETPIRIGLFSYFTPSWKYHLKQMILEEEPLKYLEKFV